MDTMLKKKRVVDKILTKVVRGYDLDQLYSGHHLFPDVDAPSSGKVVAFSKQAFMVVNSKRAPGETVRGIGISYSDQEYVLANRLLEGIVPEEDVEESAKANIALKTETVNTVYESMRLEGEYDKASLANDPDHYPATNKMALSGGSLWSNPAADIKAQVKTAKLAIRAKTGRDPNIFHLDAIGFSNLDNNADINEKLKKTSKAFADEAFLQEYFGIEKVVVGKAIYAEELNGDFIDLWRDNSILAYVAPKPLRSKKSPSYGYNYANKDYPVVEKEYFENSDRSYHIPVKFRDKAIITDNGAGFLFQNTAG